MHSQELFRSPIDLVRLLSAKPTPTPARMSKKSIEQKRKQLAQNYRKLAQVTRSLLTFDEVLQLIYNEDGANPLDIFEQIKTKHLSQEQHIEAMQLFNDMWNFFPHRMLNDNSPIDMVQKHLT